MPHPALIEKRKVELVRTGARLMLLYEPQLQQILFPELIPLSGLARRRDVELPVHTDAGGAAVRAGK